MAGTSATQSGKEIQIFKSENDKLILNQEALEEVICHQSIGQRPISIVAIVGAFRGGKSFLLNFLMRYLRNKGYENENWLGKPEDTVDKGFKWEGGEDGVTSGMTIWSEPFIINRQGKEIAVILMDTQGAFDGDKSSSETVQVFTTSLIMSSLVIFNVQKQIQEDNLEYLEYFTLYSQFLKEKADKPLSQAALMFLVRDWVHGQEFGLSAGEKHLNNTASKKNSSMSSIKKTFGKELHCYLLPMPEKSVMESGKNTVRIKDVSDRFLKYVGELATELFHPSSKLLKENKTCGRNLVNIVINSWESFEDLSQPEKPADLASKIYVMECQNDIEADYDAALKELAAETISINEFERQSIKKQDESLKSYYGQVSRFNKNHIENGALTLQEKLQQKHNLNLAVLEEKQEKKSNEKLVLKRDFESSYIDECIEIFCGNDPANVKLTSLGIRYKNIKHRVRSKFSTLSEDEHREIESFMKHCFGVYEKRITLNERLKSAQICRDESTQEMRTSLEKSIEKFKDFVEGLQLDAEFENELTTAAMTCAKTDNGICIDPIMAKIDMAILEGSTMAKLYGVLEERKYIYVETDDMEKLFAGTENEFLELFVEHTKKYSQKQNMELLNLFIERHLECEFDFAKKNNAINLEFIESELKKFILGAKLEYMKHMYNMSKSAYVETEILEKENEKLQRDLIDGLYQLSGSKANATNIIQKHRNILQNELSSLFQGLKESNKKNKAFFNRVVGKVSPVSMAAGYAAGNAAVIPVVMVAAEVGVAAVMLGAATAGVATAAIGLSCYGLYRLSKRKSHENQRVFLQKHISSTERNLKAAASKQN